MNLIHVPSHPGLKLGKREEAKPRLLHFNTIKRLAGIDTSSPQPFDYSQGLPDDLGAMYNDQFGCCVDAAKGHRYQGVKMFTTGQFIPGNVLQDSVLNLYRADTGFDPSQTGPGGNPTDQGSDMQETAEHLVKVGMTMPDGSVDKFAAAFLVDVSNVQDLMYCGRECYGIDFGITVTTNVMPADGSAPPKVWYAGGTALGGHGIYQFGMLPNGNWKPNSWGGWYEITPGYWAQNATIAICYVGQDALKNGKTVLNLDTAGWENALADHYSQAA